MSLSCSCEWDPEPGMHCWYEPDGYSVLGTSKRKRCCSCNDFINIGDTVASVKRYKVPETDVEISIYGDDGQIPLANHYLCERCADLNFSLTELGYCASPEDNQLDLIAEYNDTKEERAEYAKWLEEEQKKRLSQ